MSTRKAFSLICACIAFALLIMNWIGVGYVYSGSAGADFCEELVSIYGEEYSGKIVDGGTEDMRFEIKPKTFWMTDWYIRMEFDLDYEYECLVVITTYFDDGTTEIHTIAYKGYDPMGSEKMFDRAYLDLSSKKETRTEKKPS